MSIFLPSPLPTVVDTVADLATPRAKTGSGKVVTTIGHRTAGDNGAAAYVYYRTGRSGVTIGKVNIAGPGIDDYFKLLIVDECKSKQFDCVGDGATNDRTAVVAMDTAATAEGGVQLTMTPGVYLISTSLTITNHVVFQQGARFKIADGATLTLNGGFTAEDDQYIFEVVSGGAVVAAKVIAVTPNHFGATTATANIKPYLETAIATATASNIITKLPSGTYTSTAVITLSGLSNVNITGTGIGKSELHFAASADTPFTADSGTDEIISNAHGLANGDSVLFKGADLPSGLAIATFYYVRDVTANRFKVSASVGGSAVDFADAGSGTMNYVATGRLACVGNSGTKISHLTISGNQQHMQGIHVVGGSDFTLDNCTIEGFDDVNSVSDSSYATVEIDGVTDGVRITNCTFPEGAGHIRFVDIWCDQCTDIIITDNHCLTANGGGIATGGNAEGFQVRAVYANNVVRDKQLHGISPGYGVTQYSKTTISGNTIDSCLRNGIYINAGNEPTPFTHGQVAITGNTVSNCGGEPETDGAGNSGIHVAGHLGITVVGNVISNSGYTQAGAVRGTGRGRGILLGGVSNCTITGNTIIGSATAGLEPFSSFVCKNVLIHDNVFVDNGKELFEANLILSSADQAEDMDISITNNVFACENKDLHGIRIFQSSSQTSPTGIAVRIEGNTFVGLKTGDFNAGKPKAGIYWNNERYAPSTVIGNTFKNYDHAVLSKNNEFSEDEDWAFGFAVRMDYNTFDNCIQPFGLKTATYSAVGKHNTFIQCVANYGQTIIPASTTHNFLDGFYVTQLPTRKCRQGDRLLPLLPGLGKEDQSLNTAPPPAAVAFTTTGTNNLTSASHGLTVYNRVQLAESATLQDFVANAGTDLITDNAHGLVNNQTIRFEGLDLPAPLVPETRYFVRDSLTNTFKVSLTVGGAAVNLTDAGTGTMKYMATLPSPLLPGEYWVSSIVDANTFTVHRNFIPLSLNLSGIGSGTYQKLDNTPTWKADTWTPLLRKPDLVSKWSGTNQSVIDEQSRQNLTWTGTASYGTAPANKGPGYSFVLNGTSTGLQATIPAYTENSQFTLCAFIKLADVGGTDNRIFGNFDGTNGWRFAAAADATYFHDGNGNIDVVSLPIALNTWIHVALVFNGTDSGVWANGVRKSTFTMNWVGTAPDILDIGWQRATSQFYFDGEMFDVRLYSTALTTGQIYAISQGPALGYVEQLVYGVDVNGNIIRPVAATRKNLSTALKIGLNNVFDYSDSTISDGTTDARAAILLADADGPVYLPPGVYAIASNMSLTNRVVFDPGASMKPANAVVVTLNGGYTAQPQQAVFDTSASGSFVVTNTASSLADAVVTASAASAAITATVYLNLLANATIASAGLTTSDFTVDNTNKRITYTGVPTTTFRASAVLSVVSSKSTEIARLRFAKNGTTDGDTEVARKLGTGADAVSMQVQGTFSLAKNDYIELWGTLDASTGDTITVEKCNISIVKV